MSAIGVGGVLKAKAQPPTRREWALAVLITFLVAFFGNMAFLRHWSLAEMLVMNDVPSILAGYRMTPHLFPDSLRWWRGPWIQQGIYAFRPVSAYLYWTECWIGLHWGFLANAWIGLVLLCANSLLSAALTWQLTRSRLCLLLAAVLAPLAHSFNSGQPSIWLVWFPVHQDLMMSALILAALLCFDLWHETGRRRLLGWSWLFFVLACLAKEHAYIFPLMAATVSLMRRGVVSKQTGIIQAGAMLLSVGLLWVYRSHVIVHPRNPTAGLLTQAHGLMTYMYNAIARYLIAQEFWFPGLVVVLLVLGALILRYRGSALSQSGWGGHLGRVYVWLPLCFLAVWVFLTLVTDSAAGALYQIFDSSPIDGRFADMLVMLVMEYGIYLLWKYRREEPTAAAWTWMLLAYTPVAGFFGWHYLLPPWFLRVPYDLLIVKLVSREVRALGNGLMPGRLTLNRPVGA